jgi:hypothetical protein
MKKYTTIILLVISVLSFSQEIEKMDKKELRVAYQNLVISKNNQKDSLVNLITNLTVTNSKLLDEVNKIQQIVLIEKGKNTENINKISELQQVIKSQEEKIKVLSVKPINITTFSKVPDELAGCSYLFSTTKTNYNLDKFYYFDDIGTTALISIDNKIQTLKNVSSFKEGDSEITVYGNENYTAYIHFIQVIKQNGEESTDYSAELVIKDKNNQEIKIKVYGQGGC